MWLQQPGRCHTVRTLRVAEIFVLICSEIEMAFVEIYFGRISLYLFFSISSLLVDGGSQQTAGTFVSSKLENQILFLIHKIPAAETL